MLHCCLRNRNCLSNCFCLNCCRNLQYCCLLLHYCCLLYCCFCCFHCSVKPNCCRKKYLSSWPLLPADDWLLRLLPAVLLLLLPLPADGCFLSRRLSCRFFFSLSFFFCNLIQLRLLLADQITDLFACCWAVAIWAS